jgi:hypothetical protein
MGENPAGCFETGCDEGYDLAEQWLDGDCMEWVCDCMGLPYAQCLAGTCSPAYCMGENPAGCFETGCDEGYDLAEQWLDGDCMEWVCDCMGLPYAQCLAGTCSPAYCMGENPAGCFETGCDEGYECIVTEDDCIPSSCFCDESTFYGNWFCTEDCGGGICQPIQLIGDINNDGTVNIIDVVSLVNMVLNNDSSPSGDINNDGFINVIDVVMLVNMILE